MKLVLRQLLPRLQYQPPGAVFAVLTYLLLLQHAKGFAGEGASSSAGSVASRVERVCHLFPRVEYVFQFAFGQIRRVEDVAQLLARQAVELGVIGVQFSAEDGAAFLVPGERREGEALTQCCGRGGRGGEV
jgi:hypothetical protein